MAYIVIQSDATTLIAADAAHGVDYLAMIEELLPGLRRADAGRAARRRGARTRARDPARRRARAGTLALDGAAARRRRRARRRAAPAQRARSIPTARSTSCTPRARPVSRRASCRATTSSATSSTTANRFGITANDAILDYLPLFHAFAVYTALLALAGHRRAPHPDAAVRRRRGAAPDRGRASDDDQRLRHALQGSARAPEPRRRAT